MAGHTRPRDDTTVTERIVDLVLEHALSGRAHPRPVLRVHGMPMWEDGRERPFEDAPTWRERVVDER
jgi:hypothetical protein